MQRRGISPPAGERMAREQPALHFLYRAIANASTNFDREELRKRNNAMRTRSPDVLRGFSMPTLFITGGEETECPASRTCSTFAFGIRWASASARKGGKVVSRPVGNSFQPFGRPSFRGR